MLKVGMQAPEFSVFDHTGKIVSLSDFRGQKVALYFYPKDMTPGCTQQACSLAAGYLALKKAGIVILGVSGDTEEKHNKFIKKHALPFQLLVDPARALCMLYEVYNPKSFMGKTFLGIHRTTFLIDEKGVIVDIIQKPNTKDHAKEIIERMEGHSFKKCPSQS